MNIESEYNYAPELWLSYEVKNVDGDIVSLVFSIYSHLKYMKLISAVIQKSDKVYESKKFYSGETLEDKLKSVKISQLDYEKACIKLKLKFSQQCLKIKNEIEFKTYIESISDSPDNI